jgi:hypothetical protein
VKLTEPTGRQLQAVGGGWAPLMQDWADGEAGRRLMRPVGERVAHGAAVYPADVFGR